MNLEIFKNKKIIITGHTGFKGSWLASVLQIYGAKIFGYSKDIPTSPSLYNILDIKYLTDIKNKNLTDSNSFKNFVNNIKPDFIFHLAAQAIVSKSFNDPLNTFISNTIGTGTVLEALREYNRECVLILITSDKSYKNKEWVWGYRETDEIGGIDPYSGSKGAAEILINSYINSFFYNKKNIKIGIARAGNVIGGGDWAEDRIVVDCFKSWSKKKTVLIRSPNATRPWQHVLEPISGYLNLAYYLAKKKVASGEAFNFGPNISNITVLRLVKELLKHWNDQKSSFKSYKINNNTKLKESKLLSLNCEKANKLLNWYPTLTFSETSMFVSSWYDAYYNKKIDITQITQNQIKEFIRLKEQR